MDKKRLSDAISELLETHQDLMFEPTSNADSVMIRKRGPVDNYQADDIVGVYSDEAWDDGVISLESIMDDIQAWRSQG